MRYVFKFNNKVIDLKSKDGGVKDPSGHTIIMPDQYGYTQTIFDIIDDSGLFSSNEINKLADMPSCEFLKLIVHENA